MNTPQDSATPDVFTPEMLARRWGCSARHVRNMVRDGRLRGFRLGGKLLRITRESVEEVEKCLNGGSDGTAASSAPSVDRETLAAASASLRIARRLSGSSTG